jgi:hypothetical protein
MDSGAASCTLHIDDRPEVREHAARPDRSPHLSYQSRMAIGLEFEGTAVLDTFFVSAVHALMSASCCHYDEDNVPLEQPGQRWLDSEAALPTIACRCLLAETLSKQACESIS